MLHRLTPSTHTPLLFLQALVPARVLWWSRSDTADKMGLLGWSTKDMPSQEGKRAVVTGANNGIGYEVAWQLLDHGASVVIAGRNRVLVEQAAEDLREQFPGSEVEAKVVDLASFESIREFAGDLLSTEKPIHLLINNAGICTSEPFQLTKEGYEITMATDYFGQVYLTQQLLPRMLQSQPARIVNMSSCGEAVGHLDFADLKGAGMGTSGFPAYARAKLFVLMWSIELHQRLQSLGANVQCYAVHPGVVASSAWNKYDFQYLMGINIYVQGRLWGESVAQGALSTLYAATVSHLPGGKYYGPNYLIMVAGHDHECMPWNPSAHDAGARAHLYRETARLLREDTGGKSVNLPQELQA